MKFHDVKDPLCWNTLQKLTFGQRSGRQWALVVGWSAKHHINLSKFQDSLFYTTTCRGTLQPSYKLFILLKRYAQKLRLVYETIKCLFGYLGIFSLHDEGQRRFWSLVHQMGWRKVVKMLWDNFKNYFLLVE